MFETEIPNWVYVTGGLAIVGLASLTGSRWGAWFVVLVVIAMLSHAYAKGKIRYGND